VQLVRILLVEDSVVTRRENERILTKVGYEVICAMDGEAALVQAVSQKPDLILLDMILPKVSGPEVLHQLKADERTADIPVIVLSSLPEKNRQKLIEAGAEEYLEKNMMMPAPGVNVLPKALENVICRVNRRKGIAFSSVPIAKES
jgi:CheY-like chemotaxis protein